MALGLELGYAAGGASDALSTLWKQRLLEQELEQRAEAEKFDRIMRQQESVRANERLKLDQEQHTREQQQYQTNLGLKKLELMSGRPLSDLSDVSTARLQPETGLPTLPPETSVMTRQGGSPLGPGTPNFTPGITANVTPVNIPGIGDVRPRTMEELESQSQREEYAKPYTLGRGEIRYIGGKPVAAGPAFETQARALQPKTVSIGGKNVLAGYDPDANVYYRGNQALTTTPDPEIPQRDPAVAQAREDARTDRQQAALDAAKDRHVASLNDLRKPLAGQADRIRGRLQVALDEQTPVADALLAAEVLIAMAGGEGSGLRVNEAEIAKEAGVGGIWQNLKIQMNQLASDPKNARLVTPEIHQQIQSLANATMKNLNRRLGVVNKARHDVIDADSVDSVRKILAGTYDTLDAMESPSGAASATTPTSPAAGGPGSKYTKGKR